MIAEAMSNFLGHPSSQRGFTFNEILVAMTITGIAVLGYAASTASVIRGNRASGNHTIAVNLAHEKMEQLRGKSNLVNENRCPGTGENGISALGDAGGIFDRCWRITNSPLGIGLKEIEVTVTWTEFKLNTVTLATLVFKE